MRLKIKELTIGSFKYLVQYKRGLKNGNEKVWGICEHEKKQVRLESTMGEDFHWQVMFHELRHATLWEQAKYRKYINEEFVDSDGNAWLQFLTNNPDFLEALLEYTKKKK